MINVHNFEKALKISWIKKLITHPKSQWYKLLEVMYTKINRILDFGDQWCDQLIPLMKNQFWLSVLNVWKTLINTKRPTNNHEILRSCIWYNSTISKNPLFFPDWYMKGIYVVDDIIKNDSKLISSTDLNRKFGINLNILNYYTMKAKLAPLLSNHLHSVTPEVQRPIYPFHLDVLFKSKHGCKEFYNAFNKLEFQNEKPICETNWNNLVQNDKLDASIEEKWKQIYRITFYSIADNDVIWFPVTNSPIWKFFRNVNPILNFKLNP